MTGRRPNPLAAAADQVLAVDTDRTATVQEMHLVALHLLCEAFDAALAPDPREAAPPAAPESASAHVKGAPARRSPRQEAV